MTEDSTRWLDGSTDSLDTSQSTLQDTLKDRCEVTGGKARGPEETGRKCQTLLKETMAPHSSALAWKTPWTEDLGRLQSMGSLRAGHK